MLNNNSKCAFVKGVGTSKWLIIHEGKRYIWDEQINLIKLFDGDITNFMEKENITELGTYGYKRISEMCPNNIIIMER